MASAASSSASAAGPLVGALFEAASEFQGARQGKVFKTGHLGLGYYNDTAVRAAKSDKLPGDNDALDAVRKQLPETWRSCESLREEQLRVDPKYGASLSMEKTDFGFSVIAVGEKPGQALAAGDVIVAVEGRLMAGLSAPQMQASFQKRRIDGARMQVANLQEVDALSKLDPFVVEMWDNRNQRHYFFNKKTGQSAWTREDMKPAVKEKKEEAAPAPVDLAKFLSHGFAPASGVGAPKKRKKPPAAASSTGKDESDLARDEKKRWDDWNAGGVGGYTEQFFDKYSKCQSNPPKPKADKRLKGSVGPGQGMEYMARWSGSKNSHN